MGCTLANRMAIRTGELPPLYSTRVRWRAEPKGVESFVDGVVCLRRGHGDCAHLCSWRLAELQEAGEPANLHIYWKWQKSGLARLYHVQVRRLPGRGDMGENLDLEDPSARCGMGRHRA